VILSKKVRRVFLLHSMALFLNWQQYAQPYCSWSICPDHQQADSHSYMYTWVLPQWHLSPV